MGQTAPPRVLPQGAFLYLIISLSHNQLIFPFATINQSAPCRRAREWRGKETTIIWVGSLPPPTTVSLRPFFA